MKNNCLKIKPREEIVLDYVVHLFILVCVLCIIFFAFVSKIERQNLMNSLLGEVNSGIAEAPITPDPATGQELKDLAKLYGNESDADKYYNLGLVYVSIAVIVCLFICLVSVYFTMKLSAYKCPPIYHIVARNILLFSLVGIVEYLFFTNIAVKFVPVKPSHISELLNKRLS